MNESKGPPKKANDAWEVAVVIKGFYLMCRTGSKVGFSCLAVSSIFPVED
jgi:hypothetical protein